MLTVPTISCVKEVGASRGVNADGRALTIRSAPGYHPIFEGPLTLVSNDVLTVVYTPTEQSLSRQVESFAAAELACVRDIAAQTRMSTARMNERVVRSPHFDQRHDLCPGKNVVRLVRHCAVE